MSRKYIERESRFNARFNRWLKYNCNCSGAFELKITTKKSLPFSAVKDHQITALLQVKNNQFIYKISDLDRMQKPFDCFCIHKGGAYIVIMFYKRNQKTFYMIDIDKFIEFKKISKRKSLTEKQCTEIGSTNYLN